MQDLWQARYQIMQIISLKEFIKLNAKMIIKNAKRVKSNTKIMIAVLNTQLLKMI